MVIQSSHLPLEQLNYGGCTFEYGTNMSGGGKKDVSEQIGSVEART